MRKIILSIVAVAALAMATSCNCCTKKAAEEAAPCCGCDSCKVECCDSCACACADSCNCCNAEQVAE